jgi:hypothetical protein
MIIGGTKWVKTFSAMVPQVGCLALQERLHASDVGLQDIKINDKGWRVKILFADVWDVNIETFEFRKI